MAGGGTGNTSAADDRLLVGNGTGFDLKALTSCSAASSAVTYNTSTNAFGCNTISGASPAGSGTEIQYRSSGSALGAVTGSSFSGGVLNLGSGNSLVADYFQTAATGTGPVFQDATTKLLIQQITGGYGLAVVNTDKDPAHYGFAVDSNVEGAQTLYGGKDGGTYAALIPDDYDEVEIAGAFTFGNDIVDYEHNGTKNIGRANNPWRAVYAGDYIAALTSPSVANIGASSCGTTAAAIAGPDNAPVITTGATAWTACRVTFDTTAPNAWNCTWSNGSTHTLAASPYQSGSTPTTADVSASSLGVASDVLTGVCFAR